MRTVRDYSRVAAVIRGIAGRSQVLNLHDAGRIRGFPFYVLTAGTKNSVPRLCLSAGVHGNEPSGVFAMRALLGQEDCWRWLARRADILLFPCTNPTGFERNTRENADGVDLNRTYRARRPPTEVRIMRSVLNRMEHDLSLEFHEDIDTPGFYLYELIRGRAPWWGRRVIRQVARRYPVNFNSEIDELPAQGGIISPRSFRKPFDQWVDQRRDWPQALYQYANGTRHCMTFETPPRFPMRDRVNMHLTALNAVLRLQLGSFPGFRLMTKDSRGTP